MPRIEGFRVRNFKVLKDVTLGRIWDQWEREPLNPVTAVIGKNGVGKSALFDAFGFLSDALRTGVEEACDVRGRGGFASLCSQGETDPIEFEVSYRQQSSVPPIIYEIAIQADNSGRPFVSRECLRQEPGDQRSNHPDYFLFMIEGRAWSGRETRQSAMSPNRRVSTF